MSATMPRTIIAVTCYVNATHNYLHYRIQVLDAEGKDIDKTQYYDQLSNERGKWFTIQLQTDDGFTIDSVILSDDDYIRIVSTDNKIRGYKYEGKQPLSMDEFVLIDSNDILTHFRN